MIWWFSASSDATLKFWRAGPELDMSEIDGVGVEIGMAGKSETEAFRERRSVELVERAGAVAVEEGGGG